jgi:2-iminobutanoate/2-iminopropanoate deaminase
VKRIATPDAPAAIGPYSQAIVSGDLVFCSGQIALDPQRGEMVSGDTAAQAERALLNLQAVLRAAGSDLSRVVRTTLYLVDMADFARVNEVLGRFFSADPPARATVAVSALPRGARVEIDAIATLSA